MFIEQWKDTAFGSDYGADFQSFLEEIPSNPLTMKAVYAHCDLEKYFDQPELLNQRSDNNVKLANPDFEQYVHYEDAIIALSAIVAESELNGSVDLTTAYGSKTLIFDINKAELTKLKNALAYIHAHPGQFVLFEMLDEEEQAATLDDLAEMLTKLNLSIENK